MFINVKTNEVEVMQVFTGNITGQEKRLFEDDANRLLLEFERKIVKFLLQLDFPGVAIHIQRSIDNIIEVGYKDDHKLACTIVMRPFGCYASLGMAIESGQLDDSWNPTLNDYLIGTFNIPMDRKFDKKVKKEIYRRVKSAIKEVVSTVKIYQKYKAQ